jgi:excisionase family DNA binding protein
MTTREVAGLLAISAQTVRRLVRAGDLRAVRVGGSVRFRTDDVAELVRRGLLEGECAERTPAAAR